MFATGCLEFFQALALLFATCCLVWTVCADKAQRGTVNCEINIFRKTIDKFPNFREGSSAFECEIRTFRVRQSLTLLILLIPLRELVPHFSASGSRPEIVATGDAGTVYLCHPFLVHSAQMHLGSEPRFLAQPPLLPRSEPWITDLDRPENPISQAIHLALEETA